MARPISCDKERVTFNLARLRKGGSKFEIVVDPDLAIEYKAKGGEGIDVVDVLIGKQVFIDAKKGMAASENELDSLFNTRDVSEIAKIILKQGEIQLTTEYRDKLREKKKRKVIELIHRNAIDPRTKLPHPITRIENAFNEAKIKVDEFRSAEEQLDDIMAKLRVIMPIKIETLELQLTIPPKFSHQVFGIIKQMAEIKDTKWGSDGGAILKVSLPAGLQEEFFDKLNSMTKGTIESKVLKEI